ncbi:MAG: hypothetical protein EU539_03280 [Promethearchaeota archaeon]|nr:MAG: hypothetical protein EU539_03280 [Candidatus Lokiarchaeota archaeon]
MWLGKFLDLKEDIKLMEAEMKNLLKKDKLTPLEFTILETIFNSKNISGYDLIHKLNEIFSGTWKAQSGTIYPILSKLNKDGFIKHKQVKSPLGPIKKVYYLTEAGERILKIKVNKNFYDQVKFIENFLIELSSIYIHSFSKDEKNEKLEAVRELLRNTLENVTHSIPIELASKVTCPKCKRKISEENVSYCPYCGVSLDARDIKTKEVD